MIYVCFISPTYFRLTVYPDEDQAMANAIKFVYPRTAHRLCRWHVLKKYKDQLNILYASRQGLKEWMLSVINHPLTPKEFEQAWDEMLTTYDLHGNVTLAALYENRRDWIAPYFKDIYCGKMTSTQRSESMNRLVKINFVDHTTALHRFARQMYRVLQDRKHAESKLTHASQVLCQSIFYIFSI